MIRVHCPKCAASFKVPVTEMGTRATCPDCDAGVRIPKVDIDAVRSSTSPSPASSTAAPDDLSDLFEGASLESPPLIPPVTGSRSAAGARRASSRGARRAPPRGAHRATAAARVGARYRGSLPTAYDLAGDEHLTGRALEALASTRPWVVFLSILSFVMCAASLVLAVLSLVLRDPAAESNAPVVAFVAMLAQAAVAFVFGFLLLRYAGSIRIFLLTRDAMQLEAALRNQRDWWRLVGVCAILAVAIGLIPVIMFLAT